MICELGKLHVACVQNMKIFLLSSESVLCFVCQCFLEDRRKRMNVYWGDSEKTLGKTEALGSQKVGFNVSVIPEIMKIEVLRCLVN